MLSQAGLNRFYPRATLVLFVSANIPDIDIVAIARGPLYYFEQHRGITHCIAALPVMALLSALVACAFGRTMRGWLAAWGLACIGVASHLLLDWTNAYGIRLFLPFSSQYVHLDLIKMCIRDRPDRVQRRPGKRYYPAANRLPAKIAVIKPGYPGTGGFDLLTR